MLPASVCSALVLGLGSTPLAGAHEGEAEAAADAQLERSALGDEHASEHLAGARRARRADFDGGPTPANAETGGSARRVGRWGSDYFRLPNFAIHAVMLPTGKVLFWGYPPEPIEGGQRPNGGEAALWDPTLGSGPDSLTEVDPPLVDPDGPGPLAEIRAPLYCSGQTLLPSGAVLAAGGNLVWPGSDPADPYSDYVGADIVYTFDPYKEQWIAQARMAGGRWYPSQVRLADGRTAILGGYSEAAPGGTYNDTAEVFQPPSAPGGLGRIDLVGAGPQFQTALYPHLNTLPNGRVLLSGPAAGDFALLDFPPQGEASVEEIPSPPDLANRIGGNAVPRPAGPRGSWEVTQLGGIDDKAAANPDSPAAERRYDALGTSVTTDGRSGSSRMDATLPSARSYGNAVMLPDGSMVEVGGGAGRTPREGNYDVVPEDKRVEVYEPKKRSWTLGPSQREFRAYHSVALLLPDGRVFSAGDDYHPVEPIDGSPGYYRASRTDTAEIYRPAYLYAKGRRPRITRSPRRLGYRERFSVDAAGGKAVRAVLMAPSATTHGADMGQALIPLKRKRGGPGPASTLSFRSPPSARVASPGPYMLFLLSKSGKPSIARWVRLDPDAPRRGH